MSYSRLRNYGDGSSIVVLPLRSTDRSVIRNPRSAIKIDMVGTQINQYKILEKIGSGGQGTVYKALDTKLHRTAVVKVLPPELTRKTANFRRFEREAQL